EMRLPEEADATRIRARVTANEMDYGRLRAEDAELVARIGKDEAAIDALNFALGGGRVTASASAANVAGGVNIAADLAWSDADADALARRLGAEPGQIAGRFDARVSVQGVAATAEGLIKAARGQAVIGMQGGL
ncbi:AsmA-like C-terminal region-containing protein, partial [Salmonella enterica]|uniref:AsmA-like C-terminal region-containing protein n=1 Tax=Salmonella enterica TaxID=28901 RepID=UPI003D277B8A